MSWITLKVWNFIFLQAALIKHEEKSPFKCCALCREAFLILSGDLLPLQLRAGRQVEVNGKVHSSSMVDSLERHPQDEPYLCHTCPTTPLRATGVVQNKSNLVTLVTLVSPQGFSCTDEKYERRDVTWPLTAEQAAPWDRLLRRYASSSLHTQSFCQAHWARLSEPTGTALRHFSFTEICWTTWPVRKDRKRETFLQCMTRGKWLLNQ